MNEENSGAEADRQLLVEAHSRGTAATTMAYFKLSGPGWLQSALTLGGGSLAGSLYLGVLGGMSLLWIQPLAMVLGIIMLSSIAQLDWLRHALDWQTALSSDQRTCESGARLGLGSSDSDGQHRLVHAAIFVSQRGAQRQSATRADWQASTHSGTKWRSRESFSYSRSRLLGATAARAWASNFSSYC